MTTIVRPSDSAAVRWHHDARWRLLLALVAGVVIGAGVALFWDPVYGPLLGWTALGLTYSFLTWVSLWPLDAQETADHATREAPGRVALHGLLVGAALLSLVGIGLLMARSTHSALVTALVAVCPVLTSWITVQTVYTLRYARAYYAEDHGIDFHMETPPRYSDFFYVGYTVGMSFAISDTDLASSAIRRIAIFHALLAYLFGTVFVAALVNILASFSSSAP